MSFQPLNVDTLLTNIESGELQKLSDQWYNSCKLNKHSEVVTSLNTIRSITSLIAAEKLHNDQIKQFYLTFLNANNIKMVYRCLNQKRNNITLPMISVLHNLISYRLVNEFINSFDLTINILPNLVIKADSIRTEFIKFWLHLNGSMNYFDRMNHLTSKVWANIFKNMSEDPQELVDELVDFLESKILEEKSFKRLTKLKLFNETCLFNLQANIDKFKLLPLFKKIIDAKVGILFREPPNTQVTVNGKNFKINNKVLYNLLTFIKLDLAAKISLSHLILLHDYNLIDPYMNHLLTNGGYNDPNLTTWYLSHTLLYIKILQLPTYDIKHILLKPLSKSVLSKGVTSESPMIAQLSLQLIYLILKKLHYINDKPVINNILKNLPETNDLLITSRSESINLLVFKILRLFTKYQSSVNSSLNKYLIENTEEVLENFNLLTLIKLNYIVPTQLCLSNRFESKQNNIIISLVNNFSGDKNILFFYDLISMLVDIDDVTLLNPIYSLLVCELPLELKHTLNELLARLSNPYKYVDMPFKINVFIKVFVEQISVYFKKNHNKYLSWFEDLVVSFAVLGEDQSELMKLVDHFNISCNPKFDHTNDYSIIKSDWELLNIIYKLRYETKTDKFLALFNKIDSYITSNPGVISKFNKLEFFSLFILDDKFKRSCFNDLIKNLNIVFETPVRSLIFDQMKQNNEFVVFNWILNNDQLASKEFDIDVQLLNFELLILRGVTPDIDVELLFQLEDERKFNIIGFKLNDENIERYLGKVLELKRFDLLKGINLKENLIQILSNTDFANSELCEIGAVLKLSVALKDFYNRIDINDSKLSFKDHLTLIVKVMEFKQVDSSIITTLIKQAPKYEDTFCREFISVLLKLEQFPNDWVTSSMIFVTKQFTERQELSDDFFEFLDQYIKLFPLSVPTSVINTQLEAMLGSKFINSKFLSYMNSVILSNKNIDMDRLLTLFINNPANVFNLLPSPETAETRIISALVIFNLFNMGANPIILDDLIYWYNGTVLFEDLIIKKILVKLEEIKGAPFLNNNWNWEINEFRKEDFELIGKQSLFSKDLISLNKNFIRNCLRNRQVIVVPDDYIGIVNYINNNSYKVDYEFSKTAYDFEFLILLIINNEEFFKLDGEQSQINFRNLIDYNILEILVVNYHNSLCQIVIKNLVKNIDSDPAFKDKTLFKIFLCNLLSSDNLTSIQLVLYAKFIPILSNPGNYLYELVYKYVLSHPKIDVKELPLYSKVKHESLKSIEWFLTDLPITSSDLQILGTNQFFEWILNLVNLPKSNSLTRVILKIVFQIPELNYGSISLITRTGVLSFLDQINSLKPELNINLVEIAQKLEITGIKRTLEWTNNDLNNISKRLKLKS